MDESGRGRSMGQVLGEGGEVVLLSQKKCSMVMALEEGRGVFDGVINLSKCYNPEFYMGVCQLAKEGGNF